MKQFTSLFFAVLLLLASCAKDPDLATPEIPDPIPTPDSHVVPVEAALAELHAVLGDIDGQTRSGGSRSVAGVISVRAADVLPATRTGETADVEDLVYIANFEGGEGYAILGADDRLATVIAITEQGSLTPEEFAAVARGEYSAEGEIPPVFPDVVNYAMGLGGGGLGGGIGGGGGTIGGDGGGPTIIPPFTDIDTGGYMPQYTRYGAWEVYLKKGPLCMMKWGQGAPYNQFTPIHVGRHCPVGCIAVALGQVIATNHYNLYGKHGINMPEPTFIGGYPTFWSAIFSEIARYINNPALQRFYKWDDTSNGAAKTASLLRGIGEEVDMDYGKDSSSAFNKKMLKFLESV